MLRRFSGWVPTLTTQAVLGRVHMTSVETSGTSTAAARKMDKGGGWYLAQSSGGRTTALLVSPAISYHPFYPPPHSSGLPFQVPFLGTFSIGSLLWSLCGS